MKRDWIRDIWLISMVSFCCPQLVPGRVLRMLIRDEAKATIDLTWASGSKVTLSILKTHLEDVFSGGSRGVVRNNSRVGVRFRKLSGEKSDGGFWIINGQTPLIPHAPMFDAWKNVC